MKIKRTVTAALLLMLMLLPLPIAAAEEDAKSPSTVVSYDNIGDGVHGVDTFIVTIPMTVAITEADTETDLSVVASEVYVLSGRRLLVTAASQNEFILKTENGASAIPYSCKLQDAQINEDTEILTVNGIGLLSEATGSSVLKLSATKAAINGAKSSGAHTDVLTFTCGVEAIPVIEVEEPVAD